MLEIVILFCLVWPQIAGDLDNLQVLQSLRVGSSDSLCPSFCAKLTDVILTDMLSA